MERDFLPLTAYSEEQRQAAMEKYKLLIPYLRNTQTLQSISEETAISRRTLHYWVSHYGVKGTMEPKITVQIRTFKKKIKLTVAF